MVQRIGLAKQKGQRWWCFQRFLQHSDRREIEIARPPPEIAQWLKFMLLDRLDHLLLRRFAAIGYPEGPVIRMPTRPAGNLRCFSGCQAPRLATIELHICRQRHMVQVKVQPHPDCIRRNQKINVTILVEFHLRVAGTRTEATHHHRGPAPLTSHKFGDLINICHTKSHNGAATWQTGQLP